MSRVVGGVYLDLTSPFSSSFPRRTTKEAVLDTCLERNLSLYIPCPKMALLTSLRNQSCDTKDPGSLSKLIRCPGKVRREGEKSDSEKMVLVSALWKADES